ncbi:MAG TPA: rRNA pseudouridine synthase [Nitrospirota bacterium]
MEQMRLSKLMSELGICSRREADAFIEKGWVFVDGVRITELGTKVFPNARVTLDERAQIKQSRLVTVLLNKPVGYVSGQPEKNYTPAVALIKPENQWIDDPSGIEYHPEHLRHLAPAGRLDIESQGLIVFTQDGRVAKTIIGEMRDIEKEYLVRVEGELSDDGLRLLNHGLEMDGEELMPAKVAWQNEDQLRFLLREGKKRQIRRMCELVGLKVTGLKRVAIGKVKLGHLPEGQWRYLAAGETF